MVYTLEIKIEAIADMQDAYDYYEENKKGLGGRFLDTVENHFDRIQLYPEHYQIKRKPYREAVVKDFPYVIIFEIIENSIIVYAVFNTYLDPSKKPKTL